VDVAGARAPHDGSGSKSGVSALAQGNDWLGVAIEARVEPAMDAWWAPIETVSNSEDGFERAYQGSALLLSTVVELEPGQAWSLRLAQRVTIAREP
jgi:hypothetical protein